MRKNLGLFGWISLLAICTSCGKKLDTVTAPNPDETAAAADKAVAAEKAAISEKAAAASGSSRIGTTPTSTAAGVGRYEESIDTGPLTAVDANQHPVNYTGGYQDLVIPVDPSISKVTLTLKGGDGGYARVHDSLFGDDYVVFANGGSGASAGATFTIGPGAGQIPHGSTLRFVVGGGGASGNSGGVVGAGFDYGGGGGGTAVLFRPPGGSSFGWLGVAGGGSGAYQGMIAYSSVDHENGQGGRSGTGGGNGNGDLGPGPGGTNGNGGGSNPSLGSFGGGGGGANTPGEGVDCVGIPDLNPSQAGEGGPGGQTGGYGGDSDGCTSFTWRNGGFGYGGGGAASGAGGGGGGFSGGRVGGTTGRGGDGDSYVSSNATQSSITPGGSTGSPANGSATYQFTLNSPPTVTCKNHGVALDANGQASIVASDVTASASDPEGGALQSSVSPSTFNCSNVGSNSVTLTVTDDTGQTASCTATVTVSDNADPTAITKNISVQLDASGKASITPAMINDGSFDNCSIRSYALDIDAFDCTNVGDNTVTLTVVDVNGNTSSKTAVVTVRDSIHPAIASVSPGPAVLWPPDHKMQPVVVTIASTDNCAGSTCRIISVTSNEPLNDTGDGNTGVDWQITGSNTVDLRAERSGTGTGRVYTITVECTDASGNTTRSTTSVAVPHDQGKKIDG